MRRQQTRVAYQHSVVALTRDEPVDEQPGLVEKRQTS
jgi:hypothetical protein